MGIINYFYGTKSTNNNNKEIKTTFMIKIKREPKDKNFINKMSQNLTKYLFDYFSYKELYEMGKINLYFMNNIIDYFEEKEPWPEKLRKLKAKYNFKIYPNEVDNTLEEAKIKKRRFKFPSEEEDKKVNYFQYDIDGNRYISIARTFDWAHKNNDNYWREEKLDGAYEKDSGVPYLINVCWINTNFSFFYVKPNNYKLYINEYFIKSKRFKGKVKLKVTIEDKIIIYEANNFPNNEIFENNSGERDHARLNEDYICLIKKEDFDEAKKDINGDCVINIEFNHVNMYWKGGWFIDGGCLKEITQKEMDEEIEIMNKKLEKEERKKFLPIEEEDEK